MMFRSDRPRFGRYLLPSAGLAVILLGLGLEILGDMRGAGASDAQGTFVVGADAEVRYAGQSGSAAYAGVVAQGAEPELTVVVDPAVPARELVHILERLRALEVTDLRLKVRDPG